MHSAPQLQQWVTEEVGGKQRAGGRENVAGGSQATSVLLTDANMFCLQTFRKDTLAAA